MEAKTNKPIKICQIGAGLIGLERITALMNLAKDGNQIELRAVYDPYLKDTPAVLKQHGARLVDSVEEIFSMKPDWIFISTPHDAAVEAAKLALSRGHNVLMEKPMGRNLPEAQSLISCQVRENQLFVGCNYRFYEGISAALADMRQRLFGRVISVNMVLGHGGNPNDKNGWKLDPEQAGGGVLIDPGIHLLDLCQCMFPDKVQVDKVLTWRGFWNTGIEEEAHVLMQSEQSIINLQLSVVRWRSTFKIEIDGDEGYGIVEGRGRSYGRQRYLRGRRWGWMSGKSQRETEELVAETDGDNVFQKEISALFFGGPKSSIAPCNGKEALASMMLLDVCRQKARSLD
ncbi:MAG: Gfo/Idh/MocA family oxidoreductase [Verrucomicrobiota bacterium]|jgi:predicted dehydrogenase